MFIELLITLMIGLIVFIGSEVKSWKQKKKPNRLCFLINSLLCFFVVILFCLITNILFSSISTKSHLWLACSFSLAIYYLNPFSFYQKWKNKTYSINKKKLSTQMLTFVLIFLELFAFNFHSYKNNCVEESYTISQLTDYAFKGEKVEDGIYMAHENYIIISTKEKKLENIYLDFNKINLDSYIRFYYRQKGSSDYTFYKEFQTNPQYRAFNVFEVPNYEFDSMKIEFRQDESHNITGKLLLKGITYNYKIPLNFHFSRVFVLFCLISSFIYLPVFIEKIQFKDKSMIKKIEYIILGISGVSLIVFFIYAFTHQEMFFLRYPFDKDLKDYDIYMQMFDAFKKGQMHIDIAPSQALIDLTNPYDPAQRSGIPFLWDHAYYKGKYYSYYGIAPLLIVTFPIYWLTGLVTNVLFLQIFALIFIIPSLLIAILEFIQFFIQKVNLPLLIFTLVAAIFMSLSLLNVTFKVGAFNEGIYHIPEAYGVLFSMLFILLTLKGYRNEKKRSLYFIGSGMCFGLLIASRPNMALVLLFVAPLYLQLLLRKTNWKTKIKEFLPMFGILGCFAIGICYYNYARFENIIEFGQFYQLTVTDNSNLQISLSSLFPSFLHFFLQPFSFSDVFPYISTSYFHLNYEGHVYIQGIIGIFAIPFFLLMLCIPFCFQKKDKKIEKWVLYLLVLTPVILAFLTYCWAGVCIRYLLDIFPLCVLSSTIIMFKLIDKSKYQHNSLKIMIPIFYVFLLVSSFITFNLSFNRFDGLLSGDLNGILIQIRDFFGNYNY